MENIGFDIDLSESNCIDEWSLQYNLHYLYQKNQFAKSHKLLEKSQEQIPIKLLKVIILKA